MRLTHSSFRLQLAPLIDAFQQGLMKTFVEKAKNHELLINLKFNPEQIPVALRWSMHPEFGFPRSPFSVYRRIANYTDLPKISLVSGTSNPIIALKALNFDIEIYLLSISLSLTAGQEVEITPLGKGGLPIEAKTYKLNKTGTVIIKTASMHGILFKGYGVLTSLVGIPQLSVLNASDWGKIQLVGLPFSDGEIAGQGYKGDPQGFTPHALTQAKEASLVRLLMGEHFFTQPPSLSLLDAQVPTIPWKFPDPQEYLNYLSNGAESQLSSIKSCLEKSDDFSGHRKMRQPAYLSKSTISGISQKGTLGSTTTANALIPVVAQTLLSAATENPASLALGFGTYDFLDRNYIKSGLNLPWSNVSATHLASAQKSTFPSGYLDMSVDYMIGANYVIRPLKNILLPFFDTISKEAEFCALGDEMPALASVEQLEILGLQINRPEVIDLGYTESVKLRWKKPQIPSNYAIVSSYAASTSTSKNESLPFDKDFYLSILAPVPKNHENDIDLADRNKPLQTFPDEPTPDYGTRQHKYFIIPWDVFGRWGSWTRGLHQARAVNPQQPAVMSIRLTLPNGEDTSGLSPVEPLVSCNLEIEFSWDWIDRSPGKIQFSGQFFPASQDDSPIANPSGFAKSATDLSSPIIDITFSGTNINQTPTSSHGQISLMESSIPVDDSGNPSIGSQNSPSSNLRKYKLIIRDIQGTFTGVIPYEIAYAAYVRGLEKVRITANDWSDWSKGYQTKLPDPRPPMVTTLPATVQFTALPDATKIARGTLTWPSATGALFYHIWEAHETAIRVVLNKKLKEEFPGESERHLLPMSATLVARATQLRDLLGQANNIAICQKSFSRLTKNPLRERKCQLEIPGSSEVLQLYSISSINSANIESGKSNVVFFAVPRISTPATPMLQLITHPLKNAADPTLAGVEIRAFTTEGDEPIGYQLYRVRKIPLNNDVGQKGLPLILEDNIGWQSTEMRMPDGTVYSGKKLMESAIERSWKPLVYQAVAVGSEDMSRGIYSGESTPSTTQITWYPPTITPQIVELSKAQNAFSQLYLLETSAPLNKISLGITRIEVSEIQADGSRTKIISISSGEIPLSTSSLNLASSEAEADTFPKISYQKTNLSTGLTRFSLVLRAGIEQIVVKVTDPLNRASEIQLSN